MAVVHLGQVVEGARPLRVGQDVGASLVVDLDAPLFDVDVGGSVLTHRSELDQMDGAVVLGDRVEQVERADDVVHLGVDAVGAVDHRVRRRPLLGEVDDRLWLELADDPVDEGRVGQVSDEDVEVPARNLGPRPHPLAAKRRIGTRLSTPISLSYWRRQKLSTAPTS